MQLAKELAKLGADIDELSAQKAEQLAIREKEHADFAAIHADYTNSIDAVDRALQTLSTGPGLSLVQQQETVKSLQSSLQTLEHVPAKAKQVLMSFLQGSKPDSAEAMLEESILSASKQTP